MAVFNLDLSMGNKMKLTIIATLVLGSVIAASSAHAGTYNSPMGGTVHGHDLWDGVASKVTKDTVHTNPNSHIWNNINDHKDGAYIEGLKVINPVAPPTETVKGAYNTTPKHVAPNSDLMAVMNTSGAAGTSKPVTMTPEQQAQAETARYEGAAYSPTHHIAGGYNVRPSLFVTGAATGHNPDNPNLPAPVDQEPQTSPAPKVTGEEMVAGAVGTAKHEELDPTQDTTAQLAVVTVTPVKTAPAAVQAPVVTPNPTTPPVQNKAPVASPAASGGTSTPAPMQTSYDPDLYNAVNDLIDSNNEGYQEIQQMKQHDQEQDQKIERNNKKAMAGIAGAMAITGLHYTSTIDSVAAGYGNYGGESAVAVGYSHQFGARARVSIQNSYDTNHNVGTAASIAIGW